MPVVEREIQINVAPAAVFARDITARVNALKHAAEGTNILERITIAYPQLRVRIGEWELYLAALAAVRRTPDPAHADALRTAVGVWQAALAGARW